MESCTYCGESMEHRDHLVASSYTSIKRNWLGPIVPSCAECNLLLGSQLIFDVPRRAAYLHRRYYRRYKKLIDSVAWEEFEIDELGPNLRSAIIAQEEARKIVIQKLGVLTRVAAKPEYVEKPVELLGGELFIDFVDLGPK